jgi:four helix bundle protein
MKVESYRGLLAWRRAMDLTVDCYAVADALPRHETFGLASQIRRAAVSVPANIAEGHARDSLREYLRHLSIALASLAEMETHVLITVRLGYLEAPRGDALLGRAGELGRILNGLKRSLEAKLPR